MKKQFLIFALATALLFGASSRVYAIENDSMNTYAVARASQYLDGYSVGIEARGNGKIAVAMTVDGTGVMEKIGKSKSSTRQMVYGTIMNPSLLQNILSFTNITRETLWERPTFKERQVSAIV